MKIYRSKSQPDKFFMVRFQRRADGIVKAIMVCARRFKGKFRPTGATFAHESWELHGMGFKQVC